MKQAAAALSPVPRLGTGRMGWIFRWGSRLVTLDALLVYAFLYLPILILVIYSFNASRFNAVWRGFTLDWYRSLFAGGGVLGLGGPTQSVQFTSAGILKAFKNSLIVASASTTISTVLGTMVALGVDRYRFRLRSALQATLFLPIIIPDITMGISLVVFFQLAFDLLETLAGVHLTLGFPTIIIAHVAFNISFVALVVRARLAHFDRTLEEAAQDLGANELQTFWRITLPLLMPGILGGALLAFTLSLDDFVVTFFTAGVGSSTLPLFVYGMIKFTVTPEINAISTLMLVASMCLVLLSLGLQTRSSRRSLI